MGNSALARFVKLRGKASIAEINFIKVVDQKSDEGVDGMKSEETQK